MKGHFFAAGLALLPSVASSQSNAVEQLERVVVLAGQSPTGDTPGAVIGTLDIVTTPGANADINRALQTLPGIQIADEGNALFVRGGDSSETITLVNGLRYPTATRLNAPAGNFAGTLNAFAARRIDFTSGGFGARLGNALSGVVDIETLGAPGGRLFTLGGGLGALSLGANESIGDHAGLRFTATRTSTAPIFKLNGSSRDYPEPPNGHDYSMTAAWEYRPGAELRIFSVEQLQQLGLEVNMSGHRGLFRSSNLNRLTVFSWKDRFGAWSPQLSVGGGTLDRRESVDPIDVQTVTQHRQVAGRLSYDANERLEFSLGFDGARERTRVAKLIPPSSDFAGGLFSSELTGSRTGVFAEADAAVAPHLRAIVGTRIDHSSLTQRTTTDPRLSLAWEPWRKVTFSIAGGIYRQIPDSINFLDETGRIVLPPMRVTQVLAGLQLGKDDRFARLEFFSKDYASLVSLNRSYRPIAGGTGRAEGFDLIMKSPLPGGVRGRITYSFVNTQRTDPDSGAFTRAPFDVTHSLVLLFDRAFGNWLTGTALYCASGRPFTPIIGSTMDGLGNATPIYGTPFSERLPPLFRLDFNASSYRQINRHTTLVFYASLSNALNRPNVYAYEYSNDFMVRRPTPSLFKRSIYLGFSLQFD